jgi:hypothetical protein
MVPIFKVITFFREGLAETENRAYNIPENQTRWGLGWFSGINRGKPRTLYGVQFPCSFTTIGEWGIPPGPHKGFFHA